MSTDQEPFNILLELERRSKQSAAGLPQQIEHKKTWTGIGFRISNYYFVTPLGDVTEIIQYTNLTIVPGTKSWVKGIANIRGALLPIIDLGDYIIKNETTMNSRNRILIIDNDGLTAGLLVNEVLGLQHFLDSEVCTDKIDLEEPLNFYVKSEFKQKNISWYEFSMKALVDSPYFFQVAV